MYVIYAVAEAEVAEADSHHVFGAWSDLVVGEQPHGLIETYLPDLQCVKAGFDMIAACRDLTPTWSVRLGIHSGDLIAGVLGNKKFLFDVWGDTVNTASRVESNGVPDGVCVSRSSWDRIAHACRGHSRGLVDVKGKGEMEMYLVEGLQ